LIPVAVAEILARTAISPRRPVAIGPVTLRPVAVLPKALATRRVGLSVAELSVGKTRGRPGVSRIPVARRSVVALIVGTISARGVGALFTVATRRTIGKWPVAAGAIVPVKTSGARCVPIVPTWRPPFTFAGVGFARARMGPLAI
jgi:hypothetical protein